MKREKLSKIIAVTMLGGMFLLLFFSSWNDSATFDEVAHIPAGYSYLTLQDYRLNPEHPPLIKDLAVLPLLFLKLNFPANISAWQNDINGQWAVGHAFLYESGNNPDQILHFARFPIMLLALVFGWMLFTWVSRRYGNKVGLLTLFFYSFSPNIIAHSRFVTTDIGAAFGFFLGIITFLKFLEKPTRKNLIIAGIVFGIVQMFKFSLVILAPLYLILGILWIIIYKSSFWKTIGQIILIGLIGLVVIALVYEFHVWNYPIERQIRDMKANLTSVGAKPFTGLIAFLSQTKIFEGLAQYFFGVLTTIQREMGGNNVYFMGTVSSSGTYSYFPVLYLVKEPLAFLLLALLALIFGLARFFKNKNIDFNILAALIFVAFYFIEAITGNLNIGLRHILPILPFIYFLTAREIIILKKYFITGILLLWMFVSTLVTFPYYLSYFNALGGGTWNGYKIATDSNYDWGQDLKRLANFVDENKINKIAVDYFGGGDPNYYLKNKFVPWWSSKGEPPVGSWVAVSANSLEGAIAQPVRGFVVKPEDNYSWLKDKIPVARAGTSIFIYKF